MRSFAGIGGGASQERAAVGSDSATPEKMAPSMLRSVALSATVGLAVGQLGIPSVCPYPITYDMAKSTIIMVRACSRSAWLCPGQRRHLRATASPAVPAPLPAVPTAMQRVRAHGPAVDSGLGHH